MDGNPSNNIDNHDRPNVVTGVSFYPAHKSVNQWTNPAAFSFPAPFSFGNAGRNILTGPSLADWDFSLIVARFVPPREQEGLRAWSARLLLAVAQRDGDASSRALSRNAVGTWRGFGRLPTPPIPRYAPEFSD